MPSLARPDSSPGRGRQVRTGFAAFAVAGLALSACSSGTESSGTDSSTDAVNRLQIMAPADPGGGWDLTARAMSATFEGSGLAKSTTVSNVPGAGGAIGLAQL